MNYRILVNFDYLCTLNAQCWARITKSDMGIQRYNRLKEQFCEIAHHLDVAFILSSYFVFSSCGSNYKEHPKQQQTVVEPAPHYQTPYYPSELSGVSDVPIKNLEEPAKTEIQESVSQQHQPIKETKISRYYEEGYEKGYDDGEDDAVMDNGWGGQYDDSCKYKGKKRKEYLLGYEEGYEAGYYDNKDSDE